MRQICAIIILATATPLYAENTFQVTSDPMTDVMSGIAVLNGGGKIRPVIKCDESSNGSLFINFMANRYLGVTRHKRKILVRFDGGTPYKVSTYQYKRTASVRKLDPKRSSGRLLMDMYNSKNMVVQITTYDGDVITDAFPLNNATEVIFKAINTCNDTAWSATPQ